MDELKEQNHVNKQITFGKKSDEILNILWYSEKKRNKKNHKTNKRRNELRRENDKKTKRGSKGRGMMHSPLHGTGYLLKDFFQLKDRIEGKIGQLLKNGNIVGLFRLYGIELKETHNLYKGLCPFHKEQTPSFTVSKRIGVAKCFGCGKGYQLMGMLFILKFGEEITKKKWRFEKLEEDIDKFL